MVTPGLVNGAVGSALLLLRWVRLVGWMDGHAWVSEWRSWKRTAAAALGPLGWEDGWSRLGWWMAQLESQCGCCAGSAWMGGWMVTPGSVNGAVEIALLLLRWVCVVGRMDGHAKPVRGAAKVGCLWLGLVRLHSCTCRTRAA